MIKEKLFPLGW